MSIEILNIRDGNTVGTYIVNGLIQVDNTHPDWQLVLDWVSSGKEVMPALTPAEILAIESIDKWNEVDRQWKLLTVTTTLGNTFAANKEAMMMIDFKANNIADTSVIYWNESWGSFNTNTAELKEALNRASDAHQAIINSVFGV